MYNKTKNPWSPEDEGDHYPIMREWWTIETLFKTKDQDKNYNFMVIASYNMEKPSCFFQYVLFDIKEKKCIIRADIDDDIKKLSFKKNRLDLKYKDSFIKGIFPNYKICIKEKDNFEINFEYKAESTPHWIAQDITNGKLPFGLNFYKYGYIPNCRLKGSMKIKDKRNDINGVGYLEHVWGDWSYQNPFKKVSKLKESISTYLKLGRWWIKSHRPKIPDRISFTSENNIFGYDWAWGVFDNNWSVFYGNVLFFLSRGPAFGVLSLNKGKEKYLDFCNIDFHYNELIYVKKYDIYFPSDLEIIGKKDDKKIKIRFSLNTKSYEYIDPFKNNGFYKAFILSEMPGKMSGFYEEKDKKIKLKGGCKMMPLRQPSVLGHNVLDIKFIKPPKGVGINLGFESHYLKKQINTELVFKKKPIFKFDFKKLK